MNIENNTTKHFFHTSRLCHIIIFSLLFTLSVYAQDSEKLGFRPLFNGKNLNGWIDVNTSRETWKVNNGTLICSGLPIGVMRSDRQYENFILEVEWKHMTAGGNPRGIRSKSIEKRCKGKGEWNKYVVVCVDGTVKLSVNGKFVNGLRASERKKGYICLEAEGAEIHFRNMRIMELPSGITSAEQTAPIVN